MFESHWKNGSDSNFHDERGKWRHRTRLRPMDVAFPGSQKSMAGGFRLNVLGGIQDSYFFERRYTFTMKSLHFAPVNIWRTVPLRPTLEPPPKSVPSQNYCHYRKRDCPVAKKMFIRCRETAHRCVFTVETLISSVTRGSPSLTESPSSSSSSRSCYKQTDGGVDCETNCEHFYNKL